MARQAAVLERFAVQLIPINVLAYFIAFFMVKTCFETFHKSKVANETWILAAAISEAFFRQFQVQTVVSQMHCADVVLVGCAKRSFWWLLD